MLAYIIHYDSGETASGKSENRHLAIKSLLELSVSNPGKKGSKLASQVPTAEFVIETFGNAHTLFNPNASHFGKYTELQFTNCGRLCGIKTLDYYLEWNRVAAVPSGEHNFHIFYYLVAGASPEERQHLHLQEKGITDTLASAILVPAQTASETMTPTSLSNLKSLSKPLVSPSDMLPKHINSLWPSSISAISNSQSTIPVTSTLLSCEIQIPLLL